MDKLNITINGQNIEADSGATILEVVKQHKLDDIPTLCHSPELEPYGSCFVCVVELKGRPNLVPACATKVAPKMEVQTRSDRVITARKMALELLLSNHYADCASPCMKGCPAGVDAQGYIALSAMGEYRHAVDLIRETNPLPAICGRVCVRKCEVVCRRQEVDVPVGINAIKRFLTDIPGIYDGTPDREPSTGKTIGIVGAGPAGLTAAWFLGRNGHKPVIYEALPKSGGMVRYGIPEYRLPDAVLDAEVDYICRAGAEITYNMQVGKDISLDELMEKHDAVFVSTGAQKGKPMRVKNEDETEGVIRGAEFLREKYHHPEPLSGTVVVVGGGNTAMDVARTSWRLGAEKVIILYRRTRAQMPADEMEIEDCLDEEIEIMELAQPIGVVAENGRLKALRCIRMVLGEPDASGRRRPIPLEGSDFELPCQLAVPSIGQSPEIEGFIQVGGKDIDISKWNTFTIDTETMKTNIEGLFAGGDNADDGPTVVIDAIRDGQKAAKAIQAFLTKTSLPPKDFGVEKEFWMKPGKTELGDVIESPRHEVHTTDVEERKGNFTEVATGFDYEDNRHECERCLSCGCLAYYECDLRLRAEEYGVNMEEFKGYARKHKVDDKHPYVVYDPNKCILCSRCIRTCAKVLPISALGLVNRGFKTEMRPAMNDPLIETSCTSCGNCVDSCPTGALTIKYPFPGRAALHTDDKRTHCGFCSLGCPVTIRKFSDKKYFVTASGIPGDYLCRYGRFGCEIFLKKERIQTAELRSQFEGRCVEIGEALKHAVSGLQKAISRFGPEKVGVFVSPDLTNEELYLAGKIAREGLGTNNVASLSILTSNQKSGILDGAFGFTGSTSDRSCLRNADLIICNNTSLESDLLILNVEVIKAVRKGADLIVINSTLGNTDRVVSTLTLDPMRGSSSILWRGIVKLLHEKGVEGLKTLASLGEFDNIASDDQFDRQKMAGLTGVDAGRIQQTANTIASAGKIVVIHSPDRPQDRAAGDLEMLANLVVLLRKSGREAELLLPQNYANAAGLELMGADPTFAPGKSPVGNGIKGVACRAELYQMLKEEEIKAALIIGEDPLGWPRTESWFRNVEFLVAMDWTPTETTQMANVVFPGSTYLETEGTRCNFEGKLIEFSRAVEPPASVSGKEILAELAQEFGIELTEDISKEIRNIVAEKLTEKLIPHCWNTGQPRTSLPKEEFIKAGIAVGSGSIPPPLTQYEDYKREIIHVGTKHYRVR